jgi:hypothetical protein
MPLIADRKVADQLDRSLRTLARWDRGEKGTPEGWPRPIRLNRRKYRDVQAFEAFVKALPTTPPRREVGQ